MPHGQAEKIKEKFLGDKCLEGQLLGGEVSSCLYIYFKETAKLFSHVALKLSIPITNVREIQFLYIFVKI